MAKSGSATVYRLPRSNAQESRARARHLGVKVGDAEIKLLRDLVEYDGLTQTAKAVGVGVGALLMVMSGLIHRCHASTQHTVRAFFAEGPQT